MSGATHLVVRIPAPTPEQRALPDREEDEFGVIRTFVEVPNPPYLPVVTVHQETPALIYSHFGVTGKLDLNESMLC